MNEFFGMNNNERNVYSSGHISTARSWLNGGWRAADIKVNRFFCFPVCRRLLLFLTSAIWSTVLSSTNARCTPITCHNVIPQNPCSRPVEEQHGLSASTRALQSPLPQPSSSILFLACISRISSRGWPQLALRNLRNALNGSAEFFRVPLRFYRGQRAARNIHSASPYRWYYGRHDERPSGWCKIAN